MVRETYEVKEYPLEVHWTSNGYFSKGWHPKPKFLKEAKGEAEPIDCSTGWTEEDVGYEVWRCVPGQPNDDYPMYYWPARLGSHGAFPVTVVYG